MPRIVIVGLGATGSHAALLLRNYDLDLVDFDRVEAKNVLAQVYPSSTVGAKKAPALRAYLLGFSSASVKAVPYKLTTDNVKELLGGADLVLDCTDNPEARNVIRAFCAATPVLHASVSADGTFSAVCWDQFFKIEDGDGGATCEDGANLPFHGLVGAVIAASAQDFLKTGEKKGFYITRKGVMRVH